MGRAIRNHVFLAAIAILGFVPSQAVMPPRVRFNSDGDDLTTTLSRHITTPGWLTYGKGNVAVNGNQIEKKQNHGHGPQASSGQPRFQEIRHQEVIDSLGQRIQTVRC